MILNVEIEVCKSYPLILKKWIKENFKEDVGPDMGFNGWIGVFQIRNETKQNEQNIQRARDILDNFSEEAFSVKIKSSRTRTQNQQHQLETIYALYTEV